jgi:hypothetical protein
VTTRYESALSKSSLCFRRENRNDWRATLKPELPAAWVKSFRFLSFGGWSIFDRVSALCDNSQPEFRPPKRIRKAINKTKNKIQVKFKKYNILLKHKLFIISVKT